MSETNTDTGRRQATVLAVDDEDMVLELVVEVLTELGLSPLATGNPRSALRILQSSTQIDLLITDVRMPEMSGLDLAEQARNLHPDLKVLFITGYSADFHQGHRELTKGTALLTKPFTLDMLAQTIQEMIE
jgi:CheY-like chemotaxis protein